MPTFIKLHPKNCINGEKYFNLDLILEMFTLDNGGTRLIYPVHDSLNNDFECSDVSESIEEIFYKLRCC